MEINVPDVPVHPSLDNPHAYNSQTYHKLIRMGQKVLDKWILKKKKILSTPDTVQESKSSGSELVAF